MANRPYLTSAEAALYCGFKTVGGIQQAVRRGKLKPAGRRGGTGTYVFATADLDLFLTGGLQPHERLFVAPPDTLGAESVVVTPATPRRPPPATPARNEQPARAKKSPPSRSRKPVADEDPVARIVRALAGGGPETGKKAPPPRSRSK